MQSRERNQQNICLRLWLSEQMHVVQVAVAAWVAVGPHHGKVSIQRNLAIQQGLFSLAETGTRQFIWGTVYFVQEMFQARHDEKESIGVPHAQRETQSLNIKLSSNARYFPVRGLYYEPRLEG